MGSCISKCMPKTQLDEDYEFVHDKLAIVKPLPYLPPSKPIPASSFSTLSNRSSSSSSIFSNGTTSSCNSSSLSTASSAAVRVDRSFSNDFLLSCVKENPHIIHLGSTKDGVEPLLPVEEPARGEEMEAPIVMAPAKQKRVRSSSPLMDRQKSMRITGNCSYCSSPARVLRTPSPSRRFGETTGSKRLVASSNYYSKTNKVRPLTRVASPKMEGKLSSTTVRDILDSREDVNDPLIALDCFIFI